MEMIFLRRLVGPADHFGKEFAVEIGHQKADGIGALHAETAPGGIGHVAEFASNRKNDLPRLFVDCPAFIKDARDGGGGYLRFFRDFFDRRCHYRNAVCNEKGIDIS